jgi:hypothetical protein
MSLPSKEQIYGNCSVQHPDGHLMFRCDRRRADWYLSRSLADVVQEEPLIIKLNFVPKGRGHIDEPYYLTAKENRCVVCGAEGNLTRHHAVPYCYRKWFPESIKSRSSHDVVPLCVDCHERYETFAFQLKKKLAVDYGVPLDGQTTKVVDPTIQARKAAYALFQFGDRMPPERKAYMLSVVSDYLKKNAEDLTATDIQSLSLPRDRRHKHTRSYGKLLVEKLTDFNGFIRMWREHFLVHMKPQFMFEHWDVNHRLDDE